MMAVEVQLPPVLQTAPQSTLDAINAGESIASVNSIPVISSPDERTGDGVPSSASSLLIRPLEGLVRSVVGVSTTAQQANTMASPLSPTAAASAAHAGASLEDDACFTMCHAPSLSSVLSRLSDPLSLGAPHAQTVSTTASASSTLHAPPAANSALPSIAIQALHVQLGGDVTQKSHAADRVNADSISMLMSSSLVMCSEMTLADARNSDVFSLASAHFRVDDSGSDMDGISHGAMSRYNAGRADVWSLARFNESTSILDGDVNNHDTYSIATMQSHRSVGGVLANASLDGNGGDASSISASERMQGHYHGRRSSAPSLGSAGGAGHVYGGGAVSGHGGQGQSLAAVGGGAARSPANRNASGVALGDASAGGDDGDGEDDGTCPICLEEVPTGIGSYVMPSCGCAFCEPCIAQFYIVRIEEGDVIFMPCAKCGAPASDEAVQQLVGEYGPDALVRYKELKRRSAIDRDPNLAWCPEPNCNTAVHRSAAVSAEEIRRRAAAALVAGGTIVGVDSSAERKLAQRRHSWPRFGSSRKGKEKRDMDKYGVGIEGAAVDGSGTSSDSTVTHCFVDCTTCHRPFCFDCHGEWHVGVTCEAYVALRAKEKRDKDGERKFRKWAHKKTRKCPECDVKIEKTGDGSCNHMICSVCRTEFCWLCGQKIPPEGHFDRDNIRGCPGLQYGVESLSQLGIAKARARVAGRYAGKAALIALAVPWVIIAAVPVAAYVGVRVAHRKWSMRRR